jgi:hypothetical protein
MRLLYLLVLLTVPAVAGTLEGDVVDAATGAPVAGARVRVEVPRADPVYAKADDHGHFQVQNLVPGLYALKVQGLGYLQAVQAVQLPGVSGLRIPLTRYAVITAKVTDPNGIPLPNVSVELYTTRAALPGDAGRYDVQPLPGGQALAGGSRFRVDDRGEYSFESLKPGTYYLAARGAPFSSDRVTYYPGATDVAGARPLLLQAGEHVRADMQIASGPGARVAGSIIPPAGRKAPPGSYTNVTLTSWDGVDYMASMPFGSGVPRPYELKGVSPGNYTVVVATQAPGETPWMPRRSIFGAMLRVEVGGSDIGNLDVQLQELPPIAGAVGFAAGCTPAPVRIYGGFGETTSGPNGGFVLSGIPPGHFSVNVIAPAGVWAISARLGNREVLRDGFDYPGTTGEALSILMDCSHPGGHP